MNSIPKTLTTLIKQSIRAERRPSAKETEALVGALDDDHSASCSRLDSHGFIFLLGIFFSSAGCLAQERGLYLLLVRIAS